MRIKDYFEKTEGLGILSTADGKGKVDAAVYSRPHIMDDGTVAFVARERLTHHNLQENPSAVYLFVEAGRGYRGVRLFLNKVGEYTEHELIQKMTRSWLSQEEDEAKGPKFLVCFEVERMVNLIGDGKPDLELP
jgi:hypothetical protein